MVSEPAQAAQRADAPGRPPFRTIVADPPWRYANDGVNGAAGHHYPTLTTGDLCALPVRQVAAADAVLLLWATWPLLRDAFRVIDAWGFEQVSGFPLVKLKGDPARNLWGEWEYTPRYGTGFWVRGCTEPLLICKRGDPAPPAMEGFCGIVSAQFRHSRKPENVYEYAEAHRGPYLELFARRRRPGWVALGNEIDGKDIRAALADLRARQGQEAR